ncbi:MAG: serine hydrolase [Acidobacteria bacterium]|nr:serine hydrolase [Acidobacteriota bacterium]
MRLPYFALFFSSILAGQSVSDLLTAKLRQGVATYEAKMEGVLGIAVIDLKTGEQWSHNGSTLFPQASAIKIPILIEMFRLREQGQLRFEDSVTLQPGELVGGSGVLQNRLKNGPLTVTIEEIVREMIASSDNTATNWCIRKAGMANINHTMSKLGFLETRLQRVMIDQAAASRNEENISTPIEMARMAKLIFDGKAVSPKASEGMIAMMKLVKADMRKAVPAQIEVASKVGELTGVRTETGIIYLEGRPFVLAVMGTYLKEPFSPVEDITRMVFSHFSKLKQGNTYGNLGVR